MDKATYDAYIADGWTVFKLIHVGEGGNAVKGQYVTPKGWTTKDSDKYSSSAVYGGVPPKHIVAIDWDKKDGAKNGDVSFEQLQKDLGVTLETVVSTPSGGGHCYMNLGEMPFDTPKVAKKQDKYPDIEFQSWGSEFVVLGGQYIEGYGEYAFTDEDFGYFVNEAPKTPVCDVLTPRRARVAGNGYENVDPLTHLSKRPSRQEIEEILDTLDPNMGHDDGWQQVIMALNSWDLNGTEGLELAINWSQRSDIYNATEEEITEKYYANISDTPEYFMKLIGMRNKNSKSDFDKKLAEAESEDDLLEIAEEIKSSKISNKDRDKIVDKLVEKSEVIVGKPKRVQWKNAVKFQAEGKEDEEAVVSEEDWFNDIVYVESFGRTNYYYVPTDERLSELGVTSKVYWELNALKKKHKLKRLTIQQLVRQGLIQICSDHEYNPTFDERVFQTDRGATKLNLFNKGSRPKPAEEFTEEGLAHIKKFKQHLELLMSKTEAEILLQWLAYSAQNFGKKILWTPLIQSEEGLGKSIIGTLMINHVFGRENSGTVDSTVIVSPQTSWATKGVFKVLEEIKLAGHNRHEVINQLKPFITNHTVSRVEKYEASSEVENFCNFIALTNFKDAIPVTTGDRRWWVVYSRMNNMAELEAEVGMSKNDYFQPLHDLARKDSPYGAEFHKFLLEYDITGFEPNFAPESIHKSRMTATEDSKTSYLTELKDLISLNTKGVTEDIISTRMLKELMVSEYWEGEILSDGDNTTLLRKLGYTKFPKKVNYDKVLHNVWFRNSGLDDVGVRQCFRKAMENKKIELFENLDEEEF